MASHTRATKLRVDDGVRMLEAGGVRRRVWLLVVAMVLVTVAVLMVVRPRRDGWDERAQPAAPTSAASGAGETRPAPHALKPLHPEPRYRVPAARVERPPAPAADAGPRAGEDVPAEAAEEAPMFGKAAPGEGIAVFPPPGTKPIKRGIIVPEDFELPPGYVRHYQATDDGRRVPAILMFHPDYQPVDEDGTPIPVPEDRVVPPDMAPPGLPIQILEVPENAAVQDSAP